MPRVNALAAWSQRIKLSAEKAEQQLRAEAARRAQNEIVRQEQIAWSRAGVKPAIKTYVDGHESAAFHQVRRRIDVDIDRTREIVKLAIREMIMAGPKITGSWRLSIVVICNGKKIESLEQIPFGASVFITPSVPYARRLEVGKKRDGSAFIVQAKYQLLEHIAKQRLRPKYRNYVDINFDYVSLDTGDTIKRGLRGTYVNQYGKVVQRKLWKDRAPGAELRYPAITIEPIKHAPSRRRNNS